MTYKFTIHGKPQPKQRPRFNRWTGTAYTPKETKIYERQVKMAFLKSYPAHKALDVPVDVMIDAYFEPPKSTSKRVRELMYANKIRPIKKPDVDNIIKAVCDALNGVAYIDDAQVVSVSCGKMYAEEAKVEVTITAK